VFGHQQLKENEDHLPAPKSLIEEFLKGAIRGFRVWGNRRGERQFFATIGRTLKQASKISVVIVRKIELVSQIFQGLQSPCFCINRFTGWEGQR
jgi:hypothetical protein